MSPLAIGTVAPVKAYLGAVELDALYLGHDLLFTRPTLPRIRSFTASPNHVQSGPTSVPNIQLAWLVDGARSYVVRDSGGNTLAQTGNDVRVPVPASDTYFDFAATNAEGTVHTKAFFYRSVPMSATMVGAGSSQAPQPGGGVLITHTVRITVVGHPGPVSLTWTGQDTNTASVQRHFNSAPSSNNTRTFDLHLVRSVTGTSSTSTYRLDASNPYTSANASVTLVWP